MNLNKYSIRVGGLLCMTICLYVHGMQGQQISPDQQSNHYSLRVDDITQPDDGQNQMPPILFPIIEESSDENAQYVAKNESEEVVGMPLSLSQSRAKSLVGLVKGKKPVTQGQMMAPTPSQRQKCVPSVIYSQSSVESYDITGTDEQVSTESILSYNVDKRMSLHRGSNITCSHSKINVTGVVGGQVSNRQRRNRSDSVEFSLPFEPDEDMLSFNTEAPQETNVGLIRKSSMTASCDIPVLRVKTGDLDDRFTSDPCHAPGSRFMDLGSGPAQAGTFDSHTSQRPNGNSKLVPQHSRRGSAHDADSLVRSKKQKTPLNSPLRDIRWDVKSVRDIRIILSIDGGGSRGIIPLVYLQEMERLLGCPGLQLPVDMVAGTSVGALVGCAMLLNKMQELSDNYETIVEQVFKKNHWSCWGFFGPAYYSDGKKSVIETILCDRGMDSLDNKFMAPFFSLRTNETLVGSNFGENANMYGLLDLLMMTSAAPTYFDPHVCKSTKGAEVEGADGGIFANHPGMLAYRAARALYPKDKIVMISLGTGACHCMEEHYASQSKGMVYWAQKFSEIALIASSNDVNAALSQLSKVDNNFKYIRIQPSLEKRDLITDGRGHEYIQRLREITLNSISEFSGGPQYPAFAKAVKKLKRRMDQK